MERTHSTAILPLLFIGLFFGACGQSAATPGTPGSPSPSPVATVSGHVSPSASPAPSAVPSPAPSGNPGSGSATLDVTLDAGPVCPVQRDPPDPACAPRAVPNATIVVRDAGATEVARATSDPTGHVRLALPAGSYTVEALPVQGLMGTPSPAPVTVAATGVTLLELTYDTGIR